MYYTMQQIKSYIALFFAVVLLSLCYFLIPIPILPVFTVYFAAHFMIGSEHGPTSVVRRLTTFATGMMGLLCYGVNTYQVAKYFSYNGHGASRIQTGLTAIAFLIATLHTQYVFAHKLQ